MATRKSKTPAAPPTYAELLEAAKGKNEYEGREEYIPAPHYVLSVGEPVILGNLKECLIEEVIDNGRYYHVSYLDAGLHYGQPYNEGRKPRIVPWMSLIRESGVNQHSDLSSPRTQDNWTSTDVDGVLGKLYFFGIDSNPSYQRDYVWTLDDKRRLIDSIMKRYDIGKMVFIKRPWTNTRSHMYEILDGKQRMNALQEFYEGRFTYKDHTYHQMSGWDRAAFKEARIQYIDVEEGRMTEAQKLYLFLSVNVAGVPQSAEHIATIQARYDALIAKEA